MAQSQFAIIDSDKDTVTIHPVSKDFIYEVEVDQDDVYNLEEFSLLDDPNIKCKPRVFYDNEDARYWFEIEFVTQGPPHSQYEISLYSFDNLNQLRYIGVKYIGDIKQHHKVKLQCCAAFKFTNNKDEYFHLIDNCVKLCSKISRKDILFFNKNQTALCLPTQITDCSLLFENSALSNFKIIVQTKEFHVHKEILAAKSPVFLAMFENETEETKGNRLIIEDMEPLVFHELLRYIYTNVVSDLKTNAEKLLLAADKYEIQKLKLLCANELIRSLNFESILLLSNKHNAST